MPVLICYDISDNNLRNRLGNRILEYGLDRINKSVYLGSPREPDLRELEAWLATLLRERGGPEDSVVVLPASAEQVRRLRVYGTDRLDRDELSGDKSTLII